MQNVNRTNWLKGFIISVMCISALAACGGRSSNSDTAATTVPPATIAPQKVQPTTTSVPARPTITSVSTTAPAPAATVAPAGPAKSTASSAALDQVLEQLFNANSSADQLNDVPQLK